MAAKFELDATQAIEGISSLTSKVRQVGHELSALELSKKLTTGVNSIDRVFEGLQVNAKVSQGELDRLGNAFNTLQFTGKNAVTGIVAAQQKAFITLKAYTDQNNVLNSVLRDTDSKNVQISTTRTLNTLHEKAAADLSIVSERTRLLNTEEGRNLEIARVLAKAKTELVTAGTRLQVTLGKQAEEQRRLNDADAKAVANNKVILSALQQASTASARLYAEEIKLRKEKELSNSSTAKNIAQLKAEAAAKRQAEAARAEDLRYYQRKTSEVAKLKRELDYLASAEAKQAAMLRQQVADQTRALTANTEAVVRRNRSINLGAQATAAMRASLAGLQTSIGMYTSSTIIAASATYAFMRAVRSTIVVGAEFQATMARTEAIMGNSIPQAMRPDVFQGMEAQIRSLGKSTQFTASEVAAAMTELGQAGLSAGDAMIALAPTLDLSIIGQLEMARAADHVTNIMMIFRKEAGDLTDIVDVLAMAVTNSNTTIDQLANALTYAGPAADTAGFSFRDTVASLEALANAGFKSNRSGTALRRLFVSLSNPTKKGKQVLDDLNVSVTDLEGNTLSLTGIIEQLSTSLSSLSDTEQLAAVQDLVGVYASSPIAALIKQSEALRHLRYQLNDTGDAASEMRKQIESALKFDFRAALSAFQEAQLAVFSGMEGQLQVYTMNVAQWLSDLTQPLRDDTTVTKLDIMIQRFVDLSKAITWVGGAWAVAKLAPHFSALSSGLGRAATSTQVFAEKMRLQSVVANQHSLAMRNNAAATNLAAGSYVVASRQIGMLSGAMARSSAIAATLTSVISKGLGFLPWIGIAYAAYEVFTAFFGSSSEQKVLAQKAQVDALARSYLEVKNNMQAAAELEARRTAGKQVKYLEQSKELVEQERDAWISVKEAAEEADLSTAKAEAEISNLNRQIKELATNAENLRKQTMEESRSVPTSSREELERELMTLAQLERSRNLYGRTSQEIARHDADIATTKAKINALMEMETENQKAFNDLQAESIKYLKEAQAANEASLSSQNLTDLDKAIQKRKEANKALAEYNLHVALMYDSPGVITSALADQFYALTRKVAETSAALDEAESKLENYGDTIADTLDKMEDLYLSEEEREQKLKDNLDEIIELRAANVRMMILEGRGSLESIEFQHMMAESLKEELKTRTQLHSVQQRHNRGGGRPDRSAENAAREAEQQVNAAMSAYEGLRQKYDAVGVSQDKVIVTTEQLNLLQSEGKITSEEYSLALRQLKDDHLAVVAAADSHALAAKRISDNYLQASNAQQIRDLYELQEAYREGAISAEHYAKVTGAIRQSAEVTGLPTAVMPSTHNSGLFSEFLSAAVLQSDDLSAFTKQEDRTSEDYDRLTTQLQMQQQAELDAQALREMSTLEHEQAIAAIKEEYYGIGKQAADQYSTDMANIEDQRAAYTVQSNQLVLASMAGSLSSMLGMIGDASEEATGMQKVAFLASKALAVAQILIQTHVAAAMVGGQLGIAGIPLASMIMAQGYASAGLVGAMAIGELSGSKGASSSNFAGAYDKGGYIPTGKYGIVGEYGPEIVNGPANVTGREATARKLSRDSDAGPQQVTIAPVIQVEYTSDGAGGTQQDAQNLGQAIKLVVLDTMRDQLRPNGMLHKR